MDNLGLISCRDHLHQRSAYHSAKCEIGQNLSLSATLWQCTSPKVTFWLYLVCFPSQYYMLRFLFIKTALCSAGSTKCPKFRSCTVQTNFLKQCYSVVSVFKTETQKTRERIGPALHNICESLKYKVRKAQSALSVFFVEELCRIVIAPCAGIPASADAVDMYMCCNSRSCI